MMAKPSCYILRKFDIVVEIDLLEKALKREKKARKEAERILENKSLELYNTINELRDVSESHKESLEREKELSLLKSNFISMVSHEFRTPLTSIGATSDVIMRYYDKLNRGDINKRLEKIKSEVEYMALMLEDVLIIGKSDSQKLDYNPDLLDLVSLIKDLISEHQLSESKSKTVIYDTSSPVIMIRADKRWIKHIVINLFSNAIKYSAADKQIEISIKKEQSEISFSFKDYGIGISKKDIELLFEPFHRGDNVGEISGTGLGLSILQKAIDLHNGKIEVESEIGKGSNFTITLPIV